MEAKLKTKKKTRERDREIENHFQEQRDARSAAGEKDKQVQGLRECQWEVRKGMTGVR